MFLEWRNGMKKERFVHITDSGYVVHVSAWHFDGVIISTIKGKSRYISYAEFQEKFKAL